MPGVIARYASCAWRHGSTSLLDCLRWTNVQGEVHNKLKIRYDQLRKANDPSVEGRSLEAWARRAAMRGEVMVAARTQ